ncbi:Beta-galactosidase [Poriferisphaera corsica]|uniref:Beta-galactosidase n=1 Tax=Poriferisphaera corsica TaxID=2528020 RepID=A0A517YUE4_9BACT|nr:Beta-galactosidase [Poriferisphaera corsica]
MMTAFVSSHSVVSAKEGGQSTRVTKGWSFHKGDLGSPWEAWRTRFLVEWESVTLPHTVNALDSVDPDVEYYQGPTWYRKVMKINNPYKNGRTVLHFEGAGQKSDVYVFTEKVGEHEGGYDEFKIDITDLAKKYKDKKVNRGRGVPILVRCDNSRDVERVPSDMSDFVQYNGVYRHLNMLYLPQVSLSQVHIKSDVTKQQAVLSVKAKLYNPDEINEAVSYRVEIYDPNGRLILTEESSKPIWNDESVLAEFKIDNPELWSPDKPNLYTCVTKVIRGSDESERREKFGLRFFEFVKKGPFKLNGDRVLIKGTHRHEDHAGVGAAMSDELIKKELEYIKAMGANFVRLGHYQQSREVLKLCDELGLMVWEEIPWCRGGLGGERYQQGAKRMLRNMINQHYNHPSVIIWGLGNENDWKGDFVKFDKEAIRSFMRELNTESHKLDPSRMTGIRRCAFAADIVDVYSPSIWAGWYRGKFIDYKETSNAEIAKNDRFIHMEWGGSSHAGRHSEKPDEGLAGIATGQGTDEREGDFLMSGGAARASKDGDWSETYICNLMDWHLKEQETMPNLTGTAFWVFKDFATPVRPENPVPDVNQKGVMTRDLKPKESYYVFKSYWSNEPTLRIYGHSWHTRWGKRGEKKIVKVYSNCPEVKLYLNGKFVGSKKRNSQDFPAAGLRWGVVFRPGSNVLKAVGEYNGETITDTIKFNYETRSWGKVNRLKIDEIERDGDIVTIEVTAYDKNNVMCLDSRNYVRFTIAGDGKLIDNLGTPDGSRKVQLANAKARIRVKLGKSESVVGVVSKDVKSVFVTLK